MLLLNAQNVKFEQVMIAVVPESQKTTEK